MSEGLLVKGASPFYIYLNQSFTFIAKFKSVNHQAKSKNMRKTKNLMTLSACVNKLADELRREGRLRTSMTYRSTLKSFLLFTGNEDTTLAEINLQTVEAYEGFLYRKGVVPNTVSFYMRILRAVINKAVDRGFMPQPAQNPFKRVYTGIAKTSKRAIPLTAVKRIKRLELAPHSYTAFARDMFMFSFYTRGMSFVDMAYLREDNIQGGYLIYRRQKTGQLLQIKWEPCMEEIVRRYNSKPPYLLPIITRRGGERYKEYQNRLAVVNRHLKEISRLIGIDQPLSMYVARHSWATGARDANIPIEVISDAMGHESEKTTRIYLASLNTARIDEANERLLRML